MDSFRLFPQNPAESYSDFAYRILKKNIMEFTLLPRTLLVESELANILGISRTPIHEAVLRLSAEGLIDIIPRKESRISPISVAAVNEGLFARSCIEPQIMKNAPNNVSPDYVKLLLDNLNNQAQVLDDSYESRLRFSELDDEFHRLFYVATGKLRTYEMMKQITLQYDRVRMLIVLSKLNTGRSPRIFQEHQEHFHLITFQGDWNNGIEQEYLAHICCLHKHFATLLNLYPDYFTFD